MTQIGAPANWYPDPAGRGALRYWDGTAWTAHEAPPPPTWGPPPWKGAQLGRPALGPGALADPGRRLCARLLDGLLLLPVFAFLVGVTLAIAAPHFGPLFPKVYANGSNQVVPTPGFVWLYVTLIACVLASGLVMVAYETIATARYSRTFGKAWLHIRPVQVDGSSIGWGRALGRIAVYWASGFASWLGALDPLWCVWDEKRQCLHDKAAGTIVINDPA
jgi:uncharacterized RDD family membrane protein YckC